MNLEIGRYGDIHDDSTTKADLDCVNSLMGCDVSYAVLCQRTPFDRASALCKNTIRSAAIEFNLSRQRGAIRVGRMAGATEP